LFPCRPSAIVVDASVLANAVGDQRPVAGPEVLRQIVDEEWLLFRAARHESRSWAGCIATIWICG
jgi:hypothetical protein